MVCCGYAQSYLNAGFEGWCSASQISGVDGYSGLTKQVLL